MVFWRGEETLAVLLVAKSVVQLVMLMMEGTNSTSEAGLNCFDLFGIAGCLVLQTLAVWNFPEHETDRMHSVSVWRCIHHGVYCVLLLPLAKLGDVESPFCIEEALFLFSAGSVMLFLAPGLTGLVAGPSFWILSLGSWLTIVPALVMHGTSIMAWVLGMAVLVSAVMTLPHLCLRSFTFGELSVVVHLLAHLVWRMGRHFTLWLTAQESSVADNYVYVFMSVMLLYVTLASTVALLMCSGRPLLLFLLVYAVSAAAALVTLQISTHSNPVLWLLHFIFSGTERIKLLAWWFTLATLTAMCVALFSHNLPAAAHDSRDKNQASSSVRKAFHFVVVVVYVPGLIVDPVFLLLASVVAFAVLIVLEVARLTEVQWLGPAVESSFQVFADEKDQGPVLFTHIYLLVGLSLPLWLAHGVQDGDLQNYAGVISLGIGDTFACLIGTRFGRTKWPDSNKSVEGTVGAVVTQLVFILLASHYGWIRATSWWSVLFAVLVTSVYEAISTQIDNLVLPLVMMAAKL